MAEIRYPADVRPNPGFWLDGRALWKSRNKLFRRDNSNAWRQSYLKPGLERHADRSVPFTSVLRRNSTQGFRLAVLGDTGEGDRSQYALVPLIRALAPDMMILNGDVAYPAGSESDFIRGFFRPYRNLGIPVWALPGNHEYYSRDKGRTFFQMFCSYRYQGLWAQHGLPQILQPGTYWELSEPDGSVPVAVIGLDTGMTGDLDGSKSGHSEDVGQHEWLRERLAKCEQEGRRAIVLFHIPALVNGKHHPEIGLRRLHAILAASPAVRLVICGHIHNHQYYAPSVFRSYLQNEQQVIASQPAGFPHYLISGGGGAYLSRPPVGTLRYNANVYPTAAEWRQDVGWGNWAVAKVGLGKAAVARFTALVTSRFKQDVDSGRFLSLVLIDADGNGACVRQILMNDVMDLFQHLPGGVPVPVDDPHPPVDPRALQKILLRVPAITI